MKTFTEMAEEWVRANASTTPPPEGTPQADDLDPLHDLRQPLVKWFDNRMHLDVETVTGRNPPRWCTAVTALYADFCDWVFKCNLAPPTSVQFRILLAEVCLELRIIGGEWFVANVALKEDVLAQGQF